MRTLIFAAVAFAGTLLVGSATACPVGGNDPPRRPVVQNISFQVSELLERASRMEMAAATRDSNAMNLEWTADTLMNRARILRNQANLVAFNEREDMMAAADELANRAAGERHRAMDMRTAANELRMQARQLRLQASRLQGGGGGWRGGRDRVPSSATSDVSL